MQIIRQQNARKLHFFDYSLWNHYIKDLFNRFKVLIVALFFYPLLCRFVAMSLFKICRGKVAKLLLVLKNEIG